MSTDSSELVKIDILDNLNENEEDHDININTGFKEVVLDKEEDIEDTEDTEDTENKKKKEKKKKTLKSIGPWNYKVQLLLKQIGERCQGLRYMHSQEQEYYEQQEDTYNTYEIGIMAILGVITGSELGALMSESGLKNNLTLVIILTCLQLLLTGSHYIVKNIHKNREFIRHEIGHERLAYKFNLIELDIRMQLALDIENRVCDKEFLRGKIKGFNDLLDSRETIRQVTKDEYVKASKDYNIYKPLVIGVFEQIDIVSQEEIDSTESTDSEHLVDKFNNLSKNNNKYQYELNRWFKTMA